MAALAAIPMMAMSLVGTGMSMYGQYRQGQWAEASAKHEAQQLEAKGNEEFATKQAQGQKEMREARYTASRARAIAAGSGAGGIETPSVSNTISDIWQQGDYNRRVALSEGEKAQGGRKAQAAMSLAQGKEAKRGALWGAATTGLQGLYNVYG